VNTLNFEEALVYELETITEINNKVFPLNAEEGQEPPFVVYVSSPGEEIQTLDGYTGLKQVTCELHIVSESYSHLQSLTTSVMGRVKSFYARPIGIDGPVIKSVTLGEPIEEAEPEAKLKRCSFDLKVYF
jgi:hypothetical protein